VTGANFCHLAAPRPPIEFNSLLGSLKNGRFGPNPGGEVTGGHGRLREVKGTEGENGGKWRNGRKKVGEN